MANKLFCLSLNNCKFFGDEIYPCFNYRPVINVKGNEMKSGKFGTQVC